MRHYLLILALLSFIANDCLQAQKLYIPRNITIAYNNGTRSMDGTPGKNNWQNKESYDINITVTPETQIISGTEKNV